MVIWTYSRIRPKVAYTVYCVNYTSKRFFFPYQSKVVCNTGTDPTCFMFFYYMYYGNGREVTTRSWRHTRAKLQHNASRGCVFTDDCIAVAAVETGATEIRWYNASFSFILMQGELLTLGFKHALSWKRTQERNYFLWVWEFESLKLLLRKMQFPRNIA